MFKPVFLGEFVPVQPKGHEHRCGLIRFGSQPMFHSSPRCWMRLMSVPRVGHSGKNFSFWDLASRSGTLSEEPKKESCCKVGNKMLGGLSDRQWMSDRCCSMDSVAWFGRWLAYLTYCGRPSACLGGVQYITYTLLDFFFSLIGYFFQLELLMASVMAQWPDHRGLRCCCGPWQHCWLWEDFHLIYFKCHSDAFIFRLQSNLISLLPLGVLISHIDLSSLTVYVATLSVYLSVFECLLSWQCTLPFCPHNGIKMSIAV